MDGPTGVNGSTELTGPTVWTGPIATVPEILTIADLLNEQTVIRSKEDTDKGLLDAIGNQSIFSLKPTLVEWVLRGCPNAFPILTIEIDVPSQCSDGQVRNLPDYITFCSGKSIDEHVSTIQAKLPDIAVSYANISGSIAIVVSRV